MNYYVSDEVPSAWDHIIDSFVTTTEYAVEFNNAVPIDNVEFRVKRGLLSVTYTGGDKTTDAFAIFAREISSGVCAECALPSTRLVFGSPRCDNCD